DGPEAQRIARTIPYYPFKGIDRFYDIGGVCIRTNIILYYNMTRVHCCQSGNSAMQSCCTSGLQPVRVLACMLLSERLFCRDKYYQYLTISTVCIQKSVFDAYTYEYDMHKHVSYIVQQKRGPDIQSCTV
ncbi:unnamed protein product, partial [Pylaiella littoralis]